MESILIKDTTKQERIAIIKQWIPVDDGLEDCDIDLWEMYREYIDGKKKLPRSMQSFIQNIMLSESSGSYRVQDLKSVAESASLLSQIDSSIA